MKRKNVNIIILCVIFISISLISVGYSSLNINLTISGDASVIFIEDIYISEINLIESSEIVEVSTPNIGERNIGFEIELLSDNSFFTYEFKIINTSENTYHLSKIIEELNLNNNQYYIYDLYQYDEFKPNTETEFKIVYKPEQVPGNNIFQLELELEFGVGGRYNDPVLAGADPVLISGLIPIVYDSDIEEWVKSDVLRDVWYNYEIQQWANATSVISTMKDYYVNAKPGVVVEMQHMTSMLVWIPRYSYSLQDPYGVEGIQRSELTINNPGAFNIKFGDTNMLDTGSGSHNKGEEPNYFTSSAFCWGNTCDNENTRRNEENIEIPGFWMAKFEASKVGSLLYSKPNMKPMSNVNTANTFYDVQNLMNGTNGYNNYGYIGEVDAHLIKNTEWGAIAYLSQSMYGKYGNINYTGVNKEIYINNCSTYITGIGGSTPHQASNTSTCSSNTYETYNGMGASTTGNIYGVYDMVGGTFDRVMGVLLGPSGEFIPDSSGFTSLPEGRYINIYPSGTYTLGDTSPIKGDALTETINYYSDRYLNDPRFSSTNYYAYHWLYRGGSLFFSNTEANGIFSYTLFSGVADGHHSSRFTITIY